MQSRRLWDIAGVGEGREFGKSLFIPSDGQISQLSFCFPVLGAALMGMTPAFENKVDRQAWDV